MEQSFYNCAQNVLDDGNPVVCTIFVSMVCCCLLLLCYCEMSYHMLIAWRFKHCSLAIQCVFVCVQCNACMCDQSMREQKRTPNHGNCGEKLLAIYSPKLTMSEECHPKMF